MRKVFEILCIAGLFIALLSGCSNGNENEKKGQSPVTDRIIINEIHVTEQPLSEIITDESDWFANRFNISQPYFDGNNSMYYYCVFQGDSAKYYLYYDNGVNEPTNAGLPEMDYYTVGIVMDGTIYGVEHDLSDGYWADYITRYKNGKSERLADDRIEGCYFSEDGIYYQCGNQIKLMDYNGNRSQLVVEIPDELYYESVPSKLIVYRGILWYCYDDLFETYSYPLWCYDFDKTFTKFDKGGIDAVNNGYIYYQEKYPAREQLYRFNCETYTVELVNDAQYINDYAFLDNYIIYTAYDTTSNTANLYRMNWKENEKILSPEFLSRSEDVFQVSCADNRIFVTGNSGIFYTCLAEIDINGNIIKMIHEDET